MYFERFNTINYDIRQDKNYVVAKNILQRFILRQEVKDSGSTFLKYIVRDGDRPDTISYKLYGRSDLHWLVLISNQIINPYWDWPVNSYTLDKYIAAEYDGVVLFFNPKEYYDENGDQLESYDPKFLIGRRIIGENSEARGVIYKVNPELSYIVVKEVENGSFSLGENIRSFDEVGKILRAPVYKIVLDERYSAHHFKDVDPYSRTYSNTTQFPSSIDFYDTYLGAYIHDGVTTNIITNQEYEVEQNDAKRPIQLIRSAFTETILRDFERLVSRR